MLKKIKQYIPTAQRLKNIPSIHWISSWLKNRPYLWRLQKHSVSSSVAISFFVGLLIPLHWCRQIILVIKWASGLSMVLMESLHHCGRFIFIGIIVRKWYQRLLLAFLLSLSATLVGASQPNVNWTGFYGGISAGYAFAVNGAANVNPYVIQTCTPEQGCVANPTFVNASVSSASVSVVPNNRGINGGGQVGYIQNFYDNWVGGFEADIRGFTDKTATGSIRVPDVNPGISGFTLTSNTSVSNSMDYLGTLRGRIGYLINPTLLLSISGGLAYAGVRSATYINQFLTGSTNPGFATSWSSSGKYTGTRFGWTLGGGVEWMYRTSWSLKAEYFYYDLGSASYTSSNLAVPIFTPGFPANYFVNGVSTTSYFRNQLIQIGVNYHFC